MKTYFTHVVVSHGTEIYVVGYNINDAKLSYYDNGILQDEYESDNVQNLLHTICDIWQNWKEHFPSSTSLYAY